MNHLAKITVARTVLLIAALISTNRFFLSTDLNHFISCLSSELLLETAAKESRFPKQSIGCAINLYGLPRSFESLFLPSLVEHVVRPNAQYEFYFIHYNNLEKEPPGRLNGGGSDQMLQLKVVSSHSLSFFSINLFAPISPRPSAAVYLALQHFRFSKGPLSNGPLQPFVLQCFATLVTRGCREQKGHLWPVHQPHSGSETSRINSQVRPVSLVPCLQGGTNDCTEEEAAAPIISSV